MHAQGVRIALVVAVLATCGWPLVARADTLTFFPTDDTCIAMNGPSQNSCALPAMAVRNRYGYQSADWEWDPLLRFDLSSIPPNATITAATLHLYYFQYSDNNPAGRSLTCYRLLNDWSECAVTWNNQPARAAQTTAVAVVPPTAGRWLEWDVTADVQAFADGSLTNNGWIIMDEQPWSSFNIPITRLQSKEFGQFIPYLRVAIAPKLVASDAAPGDAFGRAVAVNGATALIGASADDNRGPDAGSAYVFRWDGSIWV